MNAAPSLADLPAGFADPVRGSQAVFRMALDALSRPGRCQVLGEAQVDRLAPPQGLSLAMGALLLTLLDAETRLWLAPTMDTALVRRWLRFHTGVEIVAQPEQAAFVAAPGHGFDMAWWPRIQRGSDERPQDGATLLLEVESLDAGQGLRLRGPGIASQAALAVAGLPPALWAARVAESAGYPLGTDWLLCEGARFVGLPRSTHLALER